MIFVFVFCNFPLLQDITLCDRFFEGCKFPSVYVAVFVFSVMFKNIWL